MNLTPLLTTITSLAAATTPPATPAPAQPSPTPIDPTTATVADALQALPVSTHAVIAACFVGGVILAVFGRKSLRLAFTLSGAMLGLQLGLFLPAVLNLDLPNIVFAIAGGLFGALLGGIAYRFSIVSTAAIMGTALLPIATATTFLLLPNPPFQDPPEPRPELATETLPQDPNSLPPGIAPTNLDALNAARTLSDEDVQDFADAIEDAVNALRPVVTASIDATTPYWERLSTQQQLLTIISAIAGLFIGMAAGMFLTNTTAALITAGLGTALYLPTGLWLLAAAQTPGIPNLPAHPALWLPIWLLLSAAAVIIPRRKKKAANN